MAAERLVAHPTAKGSGVARTPSVPPDFPYVMKLRDGRTVALEIPGKWVSADRDGTPAFLPEAVRMLDRIRALFNSVRSITPTPGYLASMRAALGMTQAEFGERLGVDKMTVSRWERGAVKPGSESLKALEKLRKSALRNSVEIPT